MSNCLTVIFALRGSLSGCAQGMKSNAWSSKLIRRGVRPCRLCSEAIASTVAQIAFEQEATRRESDAALLPRSSSRTMYPRRMTTAAKWRSSDCRSHAQLRQPVRVHPGQAADGIRVIQLAPTALRIRAAGSTSWPTDRAASAARSAPSASRRRRGRPPRRRTKTDDAG